MKSTGQTLLLTGVSAAALLLSATASHAGAFALKERSARAQGLSFAGASAGSGGLSSIGFNPAAIGLMDPELHSVELSGGISLIQPIADGTVTVNGVATGETVDADKLGGVGSSYLGYRLLDDVLIGFSIYTPFGLATVYEETSSVAADAISSELKTIQLSPIIAYQPTDNLTLAFTAHMLYAEARLTSSVVNLDGDNIDASFGVGFMYEPIDGTTIGAAYQHGYNLRLTGQADLRSAAAFGPLAGTSGGLSAAAELPATVSIGIQQDLTDSFRLYGEAQWQNWSRFDSLDLTIRTVGPTIFLQDEQNYDDAFFVAFGGEYDITNSFTMRAGVAWDQTPTNSDLIGGQLNPLATNRTPRVPDEDRIWLSIGGSYDMNEHMTIDAGYSYLFAIEDPVVGPRTAVPGTQITYDGGAHVFSIGGSMKF